MQRLPELQVTPAHLIWTSSASPANSDSKCHSPVRYCMRGGGTSARFILQILPDNWVPTSSVVKFLILSASAISFIKYTFTTLPFNSLKSRSKIFSLVNYIYMPRFPTTLHISLVYNQVLQKADIYVSLLAKKLGQPFTEIHADTISANKQKKAVMVW